MSEVLEKRVTEIETLVWEIPNLLNLRFARFETAITDNASRVAAVERVLVGLQSDVSDMRRGVTRQLVERDRRLSAMEGKLTDPDRRLAGIEQTVVDKLADLDQRFTKMGQTIAQSFQQVEQGLAGRDSRFGSTELRVGELDQKLDQILRLIVKS